MKSTPILKTMTKLVLIYHGLGASEIGCTQLMTVLRMNLDPEKYMTDFITPEEIIKGTKLNQASLIAFGAGYTSGFATALGDEGLRNLHYYVLSGHSYLGLGAGGYFGCDFIEFDKGGPLEKLTERELRFFPGVCRGPVYPGFKYGTNKGLHAAPITFTSDNFTSSFDAMIDGGGAFYPSQPPKPGSPVQEVEIVAKFADLLNSPAAIVRTTVGGSGLAVLSGVHLEYDMPSFIDSNPELLHVKEKFVASRSDQLSAFKSLLKMLKLDIVQE